MPQGGFITSDRFSNPPEYPEIVSDIFLTSENPLHIESTEYSTLEEERIPLIESPQMTKQSNDRHCLLPPNPSPPLIVPPLASTAASTPIENPATKSLNSSLDHIHSLPFFDPTTNSLMNIPNLPFNPNGPINVPAMNPPAHHLSARLLYAPPSPGSSVHFYIGTNPHGSLASMVTVNGQYPPNYASYMNYAPFYFQPVLLKDRYPHYYRQHFGSKFGSDDGYLSKDGKDANNGLSFVVSESGGLVLCRICQTPGTERSLISPCKCAGSVRYVHKYCLTKWLEINPNRNRKSQICELCQYTYHRKKKFKFKDWKWPQCSTRDKLFHLLFVISVIVMIGCATAFIICFKKDKGLRKNEELELNEGEIVTLSCGVLFFLSFFMGMYAEIKARNPIYKICSQTLSLNQSWIIDDYYGDFNHKNPLSRPLNDRGGGYYDENGMDRRDDGFRSNNGAVEGNKRDRGGTKRLFSTLFKSGVNSASVRRPNPRRLTNRRKTEGETTPLPSTPDSLFNQNLIIPNNLVSISSNINPSSRVDILPTIKEIIISSASAQTTILNQCVTNSTPNLNRNNNVQNNDTSNISNVHCPSSQHLPFIICTDHSNQNVNSASNQPTLIGPYTNISRPRHRTISEDQAMFYSDSGLAHVKRHFSLPVNNYYPPLPPPFTFLARNLDKDQISKAVGNR
ncbi:unnamed protein product [Gordionus sp. m RMFG-2023]|uniref:uncharacterized protein LOC135927989 n=1 Tax=Gordionus sp. m RMFG-2023 TaxID=3053472 RepID=UPI0030E11268